MDEITHGGTRRLFLLLCAENYVHTVRITTSSRGSVSKMDLAPLIRFCIMMGGVVVFLWERGDELERRARDG